MQNKNITLWEKGDKRRLYFKEAQEVYGMENLYIDLITNRINYYVDKSSFGAVMLFAKQLGISNIIDLAFKIIEDSKEEAKELYNIDLNSLNLKMWNA